MQFHIYTQNGKHFCKPVFNFISYIKLDELVVENIDVQVGAFKNAYVGVLKNHIVCAILPYEEKDSDGIEVSNLTKIKDLGMPT